MTARYRIDERQLASGRPARIVRIDVDGFAVVPLFLNEASGGEQTIAIRLAEARVGTTLTPVPPAAQKLDAPDSVDLPKIGTVKLLAERAARSVNADALIAPLHLLRLAAGGFADNEILINANHFLFLAPELKGRFDAFGDPIGLTLAEGIVETPPFAHRACLLMGERGPAIRRIGFADCQIDLADGSTIPTHPFGPPQDIGAAVGFGLFHGSASGRTPPSKDTWEAAFVGRHPVALKKGGGLPIPRAGCVVRLAPGQDTDVLHAPITYRLPDDWRHGVEAGPVIVENGRILGEADDVFRREHMVAHPELPDDCPLSPYDWKGDWHDTIAARLGAGIDSDGRLFFILVEGDSSFAELSKPRKGATLHDLASVLADEGATTAMHLDGGGSAQALTSAGGALISSRDVYHAMPQSPAQIDRPLPLGLRLY